MVEYLNRINLILIHKGYLIMKKMYIQFKFSYLIKSNVDFVSQLS